MANQPLALGVARMEDLDGDAVVLPLSRPVSPENPPDLLGRPLDLNGEPVVLHGLTVG